MKLGPLTQRAASFLYDALRSANGVAIPTSDPKAFSQELYRARRKLKDPDLATLSIVLSPDNREVWITKGNPYAGKSRTGVEENNT